MSGVGKPLALVGSGVILLVGLWFSIPHDQSLKEVPYYDPIEVGLKENLKPGEHHTVSDFSLVNQVGDTVTRKNFAGKLTVVDFFFTTCQGICPRMTTQMSRVYEAFKGNDSVLFLSHTVNPENDSVSVMAATAKKYNADVRQWHFVTGDKAQIYKLARTSYLVSDTEGDGGKEDFVHSEKFTLVDGDGHIRGLYDGTDERDVDMLMKDIRILLSQSR